MVEALGHNLPVVFMGVFAVGAGLAGLAGAVAGAFFPTGPNMGVDFGTLVFVVVVVGGLGSLEGALLASLLIGLFMSFSVGFDGSLADLLGLVGLGDWAHEVGGLLTLQLSTIAASTPFLLMLLVLLFRPAGLLGDRQMTTARAMTLRQVVLIVLGLAVLTALPLVLSPSLVNAAIKMLIAALFALAFSLAMGQAGMLSFGHSAYYGLGAFAALHLMKAVEEHVLAWPTPLVPLVGATAGLLAGIVFGWFATQRTGVYFAMVTLALAELLFTLAPTWNSLFGGESGISTMRMPSWAFSVRAMTPMSTT